MQLKRMYDQTYNWLNERAGLDEVLQFLRHKEVPVFKASICYYFGGLSLFLFGVQVLTGILLLLYYRPGANTSFESLQLITSQVHFGWLVREIHSWSANLMIFAVFLHMFSVFFLKAYRKPRELTWMSGMVMLGLALGFGFSGYLLPWNSLAFFATKVGTDMAGSVPLAGNLIVEIIRGGPEVTGATLSRFFGIHVCVLPGIFIAVLGFHLYLIQRQGISQPLSWEKLPPEKRKVMSFFPNFTLREMMLWLAALLVINALAVFFPWELGVKADPFAPAPAGIKPEWYFLFMFQALKFLPAHVGPVEGELLGLAVFNLGGLLWFTLPLWDRWSGTGSPRARLITLLGAVVVVFIGLMTFLGYVLS